MLPISWEVFQNMIVEDDIKALTYDVSPIGSEEEEQQGGEGGAMGDIAEQERKEEGTEIERERVEKKREETKKETKEGEKEAEKVEQGEVSPETLGREATATLTALSTPTKPKKKKEKIDLHVFQGYEKHNN